MFFDEAIRQVGAAMRAVTVDEAVGAGLVLIERQVFAEQADRLHRLLIERGCRRKRMPIAAQVVAHRRAWPDLGNQFVFCFAEHGRSPQVY